MGAETSKSIPRRLRDPGFMQEYFVGVGLDVGAGGDPLSRYVPLFPRLIKVETFDVPGSDATFTGDGTTLAPLADNTFDFVHCVVPGQVVGTPTGPMPIEKVRAGDRVLGYSGYVGVRRVYRMPYRGGVMRLETPQGVAVVTTNHPVATPLGWVQANQLRSSSQVATCPAEVQAPDLVDGRHIFSRITRSAALLAKRPMPVIVSGATSREGEDDLGLTLLPNQMWHDPSEYGARTITPTVYDDALTGFGVERGARRFAQAVPNLRRGEYFGHSAEDLGVAIDDLDLRLNAARADTKSDAALAIDYTGEPRPVRYENLHDLKIQPYRGDVWNLETDDGTFVVGGILTHNSSHCLEHILDPVVALQHWLRVTKPGGHVIVIVPDEELYERGVWPSQFNMDHKVSFRMARFPYTAQLKDSICVPQMLATFVQGDDCMLVKCERLESTYLPGVIVDQTIGIGECAIEFVLRKL